MNRILIITCSNQNDAIYKELSNSYAHSQIILSKDGSDARRKHLNQNFDLIVINSPLKDELGHELALMLAKTTSAGILLIVKSDLYDQIADRVEDEGVVVIPKPVNKQYFYQALRIVSATQKRLVSLQNENLKLQHRIEDIRIVDRAKFALIKYLNFTEPQAHRYIEKHAMDMRISKREVAENIIKTYDTWRDSI